MRSERLFCEQLGYYLLCANTYGVGAAMALRQMQAHQKLHAGVQVKTLGDDKAYHRKDFVAGVGGAA